MAKQSQAPSSTGRTDPRHTAEFRSKVAMAAVMSGKSVADVAREYDVSIDLVEKWRMRLLAQSAGLAMDKTEDSARSRAERARMQAKIGRLTMKDESLDKAMACGWLTGRRSKNEE